MADLERFRRLGQALTQGGQDVLKEKVDDPMDEIRRQQQAQALANAKLKSLQSTGEKAAITQQDMAPYGSVVVPEDQLGQMNSSQVAGLDAIARLKARDAEMKKQLMMEEAARAQSEAEFNPADYQPVDRSRFQKLRQGLK